MTSRRGIVTAAGRGTRSRDIVPGCVEKALFPLPAGGSPLARASTILSELGYTITVVSGGGQVLEWCQANEYHHVVAPPIGEARAVESALLRLSADRIVVFSGDNVLPREPTAAALREAEDWPAAVALSPPDGRLDRAFAWLAPDGRRITRIIERPRDASGGFIKLGLYSFSREVLTLAIHNAVQKHIGEEVTMTHVLEAVLESGVTPLLALPLPSFYDVGTREGYKRCCEWMEVHGAWW